MAGYKDLDFNERRAASEKAREQALAKLKARAPIDEAELARRRAAAEAREAAQAAKREAAKLAKEEEARAKEEAAADAVKAGERTEQERKAARDERYAARKKKARR